VVDAPRAPAGALTVQTVDALEAMRARRSIARLVEPAPSDAELATILAAGVAAPDHEELRPWRFLVMRDHAKDAFGQVLLDAYLARCRATGVEPTDGQKTKERTKLGRAPLVVVVGAVRTADTKIPWIEQQLAAGAAAENILLACAALGYGSMWRTGDSAYDDDVKAALGLSPADAIVAFLYIGTPAAGAPPAPRQADPAPYTTVWTPTRRT
jgi:nitroreductase